MSVKTISAVDGRTFKLGRHAMVTPYPMLKLKYYLAMTDGGKLPPSPTTVDYTPAAASAMAQMYLNDRLGCCVPAWMARTVGIHTANAGLSAAIASDAEIETIYEKVGGYVPGNESTDNGCDELDALAYWQNTGITVAGQVHKIAGKLSIDATNPAEVRLAIWLFETIMFGVPLPEAWITPFPGPNFTWKKAGPPVPGNGHCFGAAGYNPDAVKIGTWGETGEVENDAVAYYAAPAQGGQLFTYVTKDVLSRATAKAPSGVDWQGLQSDFQALAA
jgi:hypothetical protein